MDVILVPLDEIDAEALTRDRSVEDEAAMGELRRSIAANGLRLPVELFALAEAEAGAEGGRRYGLISGHRRLAAFRALAESEVDGGRFAAIPAFLRAPRSEAEALAAMVEENSVRADLSPWEQGRIALDARESGAFDTLDAAVEALYASADRRKRGRVRAVAGVAEALGGFLERPESLSLRQLMRLSHALGAGYGELMAATLDETPPKPEAQWAALLPILMEAETVGEAEPDRTRPGRPRRRLALRRGLSIRRELTQGGWLLRFTGPEARSELIDEVFDEIERRFGRTEEARGGW